MTISYNYTVAANTPTTLVSTDTFTYGSGTWEDKLTSYNGQSIVYDNIGNPTTYLGANLTWRGRELESYSKGSKSYDYSYDVDGMRYQKIVKNNGSETERYNYVYADGQLILLSYTTGGVTKNAKFIYDSTGEVRGFIVDGTQEYLYAKNAQGDIVAIVNESGVAVVRYIYDAWGNTNITTDSGYENLVNLSPFAYRGYCYDNDIKMYYLQSRYYDPQICRFINADSSEYLGVSGGVISYNLMVYCENDPINRVDATGTWAYDVHAGYYTNFKDATKKGVLIDTFTKKSDKKYIYSNNLLKTVYIPYVVDGDKDVYYGTYYWAINSNIHADNAKRISDYCNKVDSKYNPVTFQEWHFNVNWGTNNPDSRKIKSLEMCLEAMLCFEKARLYKKGTSKYKSHVKDGLKYLGFALHPIQDFYAHTLDRCYIINVPVSDGYTPANTYYVRVWSHIQADDITDNPNERQEQLFKTAKMTKDILKVFVDAYPDILKNSYRK